QPARPGEPAGYGVMAHRRDSTTVDRSHSSDHQHYIGAMQPVSRGSATSTAQYGASGELDDRRRSANHDDGLLDPRSTDSGGLGLHGMDADPQYVAPWLSAPSGDHKELLKFTTNGRWNAIAAAPNGEPTCAIAGHDGLFLRKMTADSPAQPQPLATNRRWILALDFKDVIWRPSDFVITGSNDGTVNVWDPTRAGDPAVRKYTKCSRPVTRLTHKPGDPNVIFSAFTDGSLFGWDMRDHSSRPFLHSSMTQAIKDIDCNPQDSNALAVITEDGRVTVSDMRNWKQSSPLQFLAHLAFKGQCISWHPNGRFIATGGHDSFKIWDINSPTIKKYAPSPYYSARTGASVHRIQWRPGHETQFAWCTLVDDSRLHVWDMGNLNHSLLYHDKHSTPITGFTWFDENTAWSVSRDLIVQCDMQCDAVVTGNLVAKTVADFSPNTRICVATGSFEPRKHSTTLQQLPGSKELEPPEPKPEDQDPPGSAPAIANGHSIAADDPIRIEDFQLDLPESFVDEHLLDSSMAINFKAIRYLARNYRYDPNQLKECCEVNTRAAIAVGHADIAKFWQFLSAAFGDLLPLKSKRKSRAPPRPPPRIEQTNPELSLPDQQVPESSNTGEDAASATTSRTSSGMFPSKSVTDILPRGESSDDEPHTKHPGLAPPNQYGRHSTNASPARVRQNHSATSLATGCDISERTRLAKPGYASGTVRLERNFMSLSHSDLQQVTAAPNKSRIPSPLSRPAAHSLSSPSCNYVSEPATPAHRFGHSVFPSLTTNPGLMSEATQRQTRHIGFAKDVPSQQPKEPPAVQKTGRKFFLHDESAVAEPRSVEPPAPRPRRPTFAFSGSPKPSVPTDETRLHISTPRHASKADLKLIIDSCLYYAENGDVQTALTAALLMRNFIRLENWPVVRNWYSDYIDQLDRYQEYAAATDIILSSPFEDIQDQIAINSDIMVSCSHCGSKVEPDRIEGLARCSECNNLANSCVVCESPVRGRFIWCKGCGHGGHAVHMWDWFREMEQEQCPSGCGHACTPDLPASMG
ncbi:SEA (Seh1-associated) complex subunit, partial [Coemansia sp. RSA 2708]